MLQCYRPRAYSITRWYSIEIILLRHNREWKHIGYGEFELLLHLIICEYEDEKKFPLLVSRSYRLTTCRARCITAQGRIVSTTGQHNHPPHVKNSSSPSVSSKPDLASEQQQTGFIQPQQPPMTNQNQNMPMASSGMMNQHQMSANINFGASTTSGSDGGEENATANINFSMSNILNVSQLSDIETSTLLHTNSNLNQLNSDVHINPVTIAAANSSINNMQIHHQTNQNSMNATTFGLAVASTNN